MVISESTIDLLNPDTFGQGQPHETFRWLRDNAPVYRHAEHDGGPGFWAVTRYEDVKMIGRDSDSFSSEPSVLIAQNTEINLLGLRADEAESAVLQALDSAVRADLKSLRIIHGKGTGALRERVGEMLRRDRRVKSHRLGSWNEGGAGVTVVELA